MPEHNEPDSGSKTYQSIVVYDGSDPAYFKNWHAKVLSHYATWLLFETDIFDSNPGIAQFKRP